MEVLNGVVSNSSSRYYTHTQKALTTSKISSFCNSKAYFRRLDGVPNFRKLVTKAGNNGFEDKGHLAYYSPVFCGEKKGKNNNNKNWGGISTKKRMKLLKGLVNDLSAFSELGFGLDIDCDNQVGPAGEYGDDDKSKAISVQQAAEVLLAQLKQLRAAEEKEEMKKEKEEMKKCKSQNCESSSSSSESSDSECDEVIDMKCMKNKAVVQPIEARESTTTTIVPTQSVSEQLSEKSEQNCCNMILEMTLNKDARVEVLGSDTPTMNQLKVGSMDEKKIEVCMGGKCKKLGSPALMEEFQRVMGDEGVVVGCKCLGKCKSAPNVRVSNSNIADGISGDDSLRTPSNAICVGVGLEDVGLIVSNYFGDELKDQLGVAIAGVSF